MNKTKAVFLILVAAFWSSSSVVAQDNSVLFKQIIDAVKEKAPNWILKRKIISSDNTMAAYLWEAGNSSVAVLVVAYPSSKDMSGRLEGLASLYEVKVLPTKVKGLGDDNISWEGTSDKDRGIIFRKGRVVVSVGASSIETAQGFARYIADMLPDA